MMTPEEKATHENGIRLLNQMSGSIFSYQPIISNGNPNPRCGDCPNESEHSEHMKHDPHYIRFVCTPCRDKLIWKSYKRFLKKRGLHGMANPMSQPSTAGGVQNV